MNTVVSEVIFIPQDWRSRIQPSFGLAWAMFTHRIAVHWRGVENQVAGSCGATNSESRLTCPAIIHAMLAASAGIHVARLEAVSAQNLPFIHAE